MVDSVGAIDWNAVVTFIPLVEPPDSHDAGPDEGLWFCVRRSEVLVRLDSGAHELPTAVASADLGVDVEQAHFLGLLDDRPVWAADVAAHIDPEADAVFEPLFTLYGRVPDQLWTLAGRAVQIVEWDRTHRFCGRCGTPTEPAPGERARRCPDCHLLAFPRLAPAVIVLVERDGQALLAQGRSFGMTMYSTLAGFVEPGEQLEEAVAREVREEVGIEISDIRYFASQPWPFPHSLMVGFTARWAGGEIEIDEREIVDAGWFDPDGLPPIPGRLSIARALIDDWLSRTGGTKGQ
jgi:NAD+ diphosphatase